MKPKTIQILSIVFLVLLIAIGAYTLIYYMGVPYHGIVLMDKSVFDALSNSCGNKNFLCRGIRSFWPIFERSFSRMGPFLGYASISVVIYGLLVGFSAFRTGSARLKLTLRPWVIAAAFIASLWVMFSFLSLEGDYPRRLVEPLPEIYRNVGPEGLDVLRENLDRLNGRGCLESEGQFEGGAHVYQLKYACIHASFVTRVLTLASLILLFIFELLVLGRAALGWLKLKPGGLLAESVLSAGLGACFLIAILWTMAVASLHIPFLPLYSKSAGWILFAIIPLAGFKHSKYWIEKFLFARWELERSWNDPFILFSWLLLTYLSFNFLSVVRPFPIGWDDLGSYLNRPRLMVSYGHFIFSMAPFFWEYLTSLGYLLFGYSSHFGASVSMMINWSAGLFAVFSIYLLASHFLGRNAGVLSAMIYYALPMVGHFSFADMKVDNAMFFMGTMSVYCVFRYLFSADSDCDNSSERPSMAWLAAAGVFSGFAFAIKFTAVMITVALGAVIAGVLLHWSALIGTSLLAVTLFSRQGLNVERTLERIAGKDLPFSPDLIPVLCFVLGSVALGLSAWKFRMNIKKTLASAAVFGGFAFLSVSPWILHNNLLNGFMVGLALKAPNNMAPYISVYGEDGPEGLTVRGLPPDLAVSREHERCTPTGGKEELDRYWGFEKGVGHYLTLPWRTMMNLDSTGYYVTTTFALALLPLVLLLPYFWMRKGRWLRWLFIGTVFMLVEWIFLANGIPWYGLGMFLGFAVLLEALVLKAPDMLSRAATGVFIGLAFVMMFAFRMWQYETQKNLLEYPSGKASAEVMIERTVPYYNDIANIVLERAKQYPERPYLYRMGTFIPYFIPRNLEIIGIQDHQLDVFNCLYQERDGKLLVKRLKTLGFNSIVFDTNTATIERDSNGTLHQKVNAFLEWVNNPENGLQIVMSDPGAGVAFILIP